MLQFPSVPKCSKAWYCTVLQSVLFIYLSLKIIIFIIFRNVQHIIFVNRSGYIDTLNVVYTEG